MMLKQELAKLSGISNPSLIMLMQEYDSRFLKEWSDTDNLELIDSFDTLYAYEVSDQDLVRVILYNRRCDSKYGLRVLFGIPLVICIKREYTYRELYKELISILSPFLLEIPPLELSIGDENLQESQIEIDQFFTLKPVEPKYGAIFDIIRVDNFGDEKKKKFENNDQSFELKDGKYLGLNWNLSYRNKYYNTMTLTDFDVASGEEIIQKNIDLDECLNLFTTEEQLGPQDAWFCSNCNGLKQAFKKFDIWTVPPILVIHLKRFSYKSSFREKIETFVDFPFYLDLSTRIKSSNNTQNNYQLYAVSNHYGLMGGGHYTAYCLHRDGKWYEYNDSIVKEISPEDVKTAAAYVLFYRRTDIEFKPFNPEWDQKDFEPEEPNDSDNEKENLGLLDFLGSQNQS